METIRKFSFGAALINMTSAFVGRLVRQVRRTFKMSFLPEGNGKKNTGKSGKGKLDQAGNSAESSPKKSVVAEWQRIDLTGSGADALFARTGGGREDVRDPDFGRYLMLGIGAEESPNPANGSVCRQVKISLVVETECPGGQDQLVIDLVSEFNPEKLTDIVTTNKPGEHAYYTVKSPELETGYVTYIPEITSNGAIRVSHQKADTMAYLGVQFLVRAS